VVKLNTANDTSKVRFSYNGKEVVYGILISPTTGKKWLDRNLGATQGATSFDDYKAYGDLFQWGRPADGHQLINWTSSNVGTPVNGITTVRATSDAPGHSNFIVTDWDWRSDYNRNRWATLPQGPCPAGWHVPRVNEWAAEISNASGGTAPTGGMIDQATAYSQLKLTATGYRLPYTSDSDTAGTLKRAVIQGHYWSADDFLDPGAPYPLGSHISTEIDYVGLTESVKTMGFCVRCISN
jgi:uncharacterized protein (TIGR02145 family)